MMSRATSVALRVSVGLRSGDPAAEPELRDYLVAWYCDLRESFANTARRGSDEELKRYVHASWTPLIDSLLDGKPVVFPRYELPKDHSQTPPHGGDPNDLMVLGADDVLRSHEQMAQGYRAWPIPED